MHEIAESVFVVSYVELPYKACMVLSNAVVSDHKTNKSQIVLIT